MNAISRLDFLRLLGLSLTGLTTTSPTPPRAWTLNRCWVAGLRHYEGAQILHSLRPGMPLHLHPDFHNPFDHHAIALHHHGRMLGYIPRTENHHLARLLRQNAPLHAHILEVHPHAEPWRALRVEISIAS